MDKNQQELYATIRAVPIDRAVINGFYLIDYLKLLEEYRQGSGYVDTCLEIAETAQSLAEKALKDGRIFTAI